MNRPLILAAALLTLLVASSSQATTHKYRSFDNDRFAAWASDVAKKVKSIDLGSVLEKRDETKRSDWKKQAKREAFKGKVSAVLEKLASEYEGRTFKKRDRDSDDYMGKRDRRDKDRDRMKKRYYGDKEKRKWREPVPEPSAALVFGLGTLVVASSIRRR